MGLGFGFGLRLWLRLWLRFGLWLRLWLRLGFGFGLRFGFGFGFGFGLVELRCFRFNASHLCPRRGNKTSTSCLCLHVCAPLFRFVMEEMSSSSLWVGRRKTNQKELN